MKDWEKVYSTNKPHLLEIVKTVLEKHDIKIATIDKRDSTYITIGEIELYVQQSDVVLAQFLISDWEKNTQHGTE